jgi:hypothetical protein
MHHYHKILRECSEKFEIEWASWDEEKREAYRKFLADKQREIEENWLGMLYQPQPEPKTLTPEIWEKWFEKEIPVQ